MKRRDFIKYGVRSLFAAALGKGFYNTTAGQVELVRVPVALRGLPPPLRGLRIGLLSDLHASVIVSQGLIRAAADLLMAQQPDVIVLTGDFISGSTKFLSGSVGQFDPRYLERCAAGLAMLRAPLGIYGVLGNHDFWSGPEAVRAICATLSREVGVTWLRNSSVELKRWGASLHLLGVDDYWAESCSLAGACRGVPADGVRILLSHNPDINEEIDLARERIDLILSGHTHGGQIVAPLIGQPVLPSRFGQRYRAGLVRDGERQTYVSRGVGCLLAPLRVNCLPEATLLVLGSS